MVIQGFVIRSRDGLPLSASTDIDRGVPVKDCHKYIKLIARKLSKLPERCTLRLNGYTIHLISLSMGISFLTLCEENYPAVLAFCFLDDLQREFLDNCDYQNVLEAKRAYTFIEFDLRMQKLKLTYNRPQSLTTRISVAEVSAELRFRPPYQITEEDLGLVDNGILKPFTDSHQPMVSSGRSFVPLQWFGMLIAGLNVFCALLNVMRGMAFIQHGHLDDDDSGAYSYGATFLFCACLYIYQVYLMIYLVRWQRIRIVIVLVAHVCCIVSVSTFRNTTQTVFYSAVAIAASLVIASRKQLRHLPGYSA